MTRPLLLALALALGSLLTPQVAFAQQGDGQPDAGQPGPPEDAGVEEPPDEDTTGRIVEVCRETYDCSPRFVCDNGRCRYTGTREAERVGCMLGPTATLSLVGIGLLVGARRRG